MSDLVPKKERHLWYLLQWITICISLLAVFASVFAGWMAYKTAISSAEISWKLNKNNEIETRIYQQRYNLYISVRDAFIKFNTNTENKGTLDKSKILKNELKRIGYEVRIIWTPYIICTYSNLLSWIDNYIKFIEKESPAHAYTEYWRDIIPWLFLFEKSIRDTLLQEESIELTLIQDSTTQWFYNFNWSCNPWQLNDIDENQYR
jgi:hypothetical protein